MGIEYRNAQSEFREILNKLQPVFVSAFMLWLDNKVAEFKMFGDVQLQDNYLEGEEHQEDTWYAIPAWCEDQVHSQKYPGVHSVSSRLPGSWQRTRHQHRQRVPCVSEEQSQSTKKRKLHVLNYDAENSFPVIVNVASNSENATVCENDAVSDKVIADTVLLSEDSRQGGVLAPQEMIVVRRSDDTQDVQNETRLSTNTQTVCELDNELGNRQQFERPTEIPLNTVSADRAADFLRAESAGDEESIVIKTEPGGYSNSVCSEASDNNVVSHIITPISGYTSTSSDAYEESDISSSQRTHSKTQRTSTADFSDSSVLMQNRPDFVEVYMPPHMHVPTVHHFTPNIATSCDQLTDEENCDVKKEPPDEDYLSAGGSGGDYSAFEESMASEHSSMYLDPDIVSNMSTHPEQVWTYEWLPVASNPELIQYGTTESTESPVNHSYQLMTGFQVTADQQPMKMTAPQTSDCQHKLKIKKKANKHTTLIKRSVGRPKNSSKTRMVLLKQTAFKPKFHNQITIKNRPSLTKRPVGRPRKSPESKIVQIMHTTFKSLEPKISDQIVIKNRSSPRNQQIGRPKKSFESKITLKSEFHKQNSLRKPVGRAKKKGSEKMQVRRPVGRPRKLNQIISKCYQTSEKDPSALRLKINESLKKMKDKYEIVAAKSKPTATLIEILKSSKNIQIECPIQSDQKAKQKTLYRPKSRNTYEQHTNKLDLSLCENFNPSVPTFETEKLEPSLLKFKDLKVVLKPLPSSVKLIGMLKESRKDLIVRCTGEQMLLSSTLCAGKSSDLEMSKSSSGRREADTCFASVTGPLDACPSISENTTLVDVSNNTIRQSEQIQTNTKETNCDIDSEQALDTSRKMCKFILSKNNIQSERKKSVLVQKERSCSKKIWNHKVSFLKASHSHLTRIKLGNKKDCNMNDDDDLSLKRIMVVKRPRGRPKKKKLAQKQSMSDKCNVTLGINVQSVEIESAAMKKTHSNEITVISSSPMMTSDNTDKNESSMSKEGSPDNSTVSKFPSVKKLRHPQKVLSLFSLLTDYGTDKNKLTSTFDKNHINVSGCDGKNTVSESSTVKKIRRHSMKVFVKDNSNEFCNVKKSRGCHKKRLSSSMLTDQGTNDNKFGKDKLGDKHSFIKSSSMKKFGERPKNVSSSSMLIENDNEIVVNRFDGKATSSESTSVKKQRGRPRKVLSTSVLTDQGTDKNELTCSSEKDKIVDDGFDDKDTSSESTSVKKPRQHPRKVLSTSLLTDHSTDENELTRTSEKDKIVDDGFDDKDTSREYSCVKKQRGRPRKVLCTSMLTDQGTDKNELTRTSEKDKIVDDGFDDKDTSSESTSVKKQSGRPRKVLSSSMLTDDGIDENELTFTSEKDKIVDDKDTSSEFSSVKKPRRQPKKVLSTSIHADEGIDENELCSSEKDKIVDDGFDDKDTSSESTSVKKQSGRPRKVSSSTLTDDGIDKNELTCTSEKDKIVDDGFDDKDTSSESTNVKKPRQHPRKVLSSSMLTDDGIDENELTHTSEKDKIVDDGFDDKDTSSEFSSVKKLRRQPKKVLSTFLLTDHSTDENELTRTSEKDKIVDDGFDDKATSSESSCVKKQRGRPRKVLCTSMLTDQGTDKNDLTCSSEKDQIIDDGFDDKDTSSESSCVKKQSGRPKKVLSSSMLTDEGTDENELTCTSEKDKIVDDKDTSSEFSSVKKPRRQPKKVLSTSIHADEGTDENELCSSEKDKIVDDGFDDKDTSSESSCVKKQRGRPRKVLCTSMLTDQGTDKNDLTCSSEKDQIIDDGFDDKDTSSESSCVKKQRGRPRKVLCTSMLTDQGTDKNDLTCSSEKDQIIDDGFDDKDTSSESTSVKKQRCPRKVVSTSMPTDEGTDKNEKNKIADSFHDKHTSSESSSVEKLRGYPKNVWSSSMLTEDNYNEILSTFENDDIDADATSDSNTRFCNVKEMGWHSKKDLSCLPMVTGQGTDQNAFFSSYQKNEKDDNVCDDKDSSSESSRGCPMLTDQVNDANNTSKKNRFGSEPSGVKKPRGRPKKVSYMSVDQDTDKNKLPCKRLNDVSDGEVVREAVVNVSELSNVIKARGRPRKVLSSSTMLKVE